MKLAIKIGVPYPDQVDVDKIKEVFPYGNIVNVELVEGGLNCSSGIVLEQMGDKTDDFLIDVAAITVGH